ncbi:MAG: hypothetical protein KDA45_05410 [Planctomycetales bacterium]|nr:hypothetical protein [Planctomycetales bacterium]
MILFLPYSEHLFRAWAYVTHTRSWAIVIGVGFALLAITLFLLSRTRWGQAKPLTKCVALSVLAHVWLLLYALGNRTILPQGDPRGQEQNVAVSLEGLPLPQPMLEPAPQEADRLSGQALSSEALSVDALNIETSSLGDWPAADAEMAPSPAPAQPWEQAVPLSELPKPPGLERLETTHMLAAPDLLPVLEPTPMPSLPPPEPLADAERPEATSEQSSGEDAAGGMTSLADLAVPAGEAVLPPPRETRAAAADNVAPILPTSESPRPAGLPIHTIASQDSAVMPPRMPAQPDSPVPSEYQLRQAPNRLELARPFGADADSEAAVEAGLQWLAQAQSADGSWNAKQFGGGTETMALGESRYGTGEKADTGVSGLALLAFLSAGHTHLQGTYRATVQQGLSYLLQAQMPSGDLSGPKQVGGDRGVLFARMYCHSIATLALAEAHAMTGDAVLRDALLRASQYSIGAQDPHGGGWRYRPLDPGDLSQFGWQAMALKSVERSGLALPSEVKRRMRRFLDSCAAGRAGGLATYRPGQGRPSETMTAEGLACRLLLDYPLSLPAQQEALHLIMQRRPGTGEDNVYFWYYATLALFQLQDENWRVWNQAMKQRLLATQVPPYGELPGSWAPDSLWGGYGGRVYSTAMSCLCLEVYYRYLPMYQRASLARLPDEQRTSR